MSAPASPLAPDPVTALRRLQLAKLRRIAPEVLHTAKIQIWNPEEVLLGNAAVAVGHRVRYFAAADLVEGLYRGLADNSVGRIIDGLSAWISSLSTSWASLRSTTSACSYFFALWCR